MSCGIPSNVKLLRDHTYEERLEKLELTTLERRREKGDLIALYRMQEGLEKLDR